MLGHGFEGTGNVLTITMDADSCFDGTVYGNKAYLMMGMCTAGKFILNGVETGYTTYPSEAITKVNPVEGENGYTVAAVEGAAYYVVSVNAQVTSYDAEGNKIPNASGITFVLDSETVYGLNSVVLGKVNSVKIVNESILGAVGYTLEGGVLNAYVGERNALSGTITLFVTQYDKDGNVLAVGSDTLGTIAEPTK